MSKATPTRPARRRPKHHRTETLRPCVQKYQYIQLPLPELRPIYCEKAFIEQPAVETGKPSCQENS